MAAPWKSPCAATKTAAVTAMVTCAPFADFSDTMPDFNLRLSASALLTWSGRPFLDCGEEVGMAGATTLQHDDATVKLAGGNSQAAKPYAARWTRQRSGLATGSSSERLPHGLSTRC